MDRYRWHDIREVVKTHDVLSPTRLDSSHIVEGQASLCVAAPFVQQQTAYIRARHCVHRAFCGQVKLRGQGRSQCEFCVVIDGGSALGACCAERCVAAVFADTLTACRSPSARRRASMLPSSHGLAMHVSLLHLTLDVSGSTDAP